MTFDISISSELICSLISVAGVVASALISRNVSKNTASKEIEQMKLTWEHEEIVSSEDDFGEMTASVARYISNFRNSDQRDALAKITSVRAKETGTLAAALDELYRVVYHQNITEINDRLTKVIDARRDFKRSIKGSDQLKQK